MFSTCTGSTRARGAQSALPLCVLQRQKTVITEKWSAHGSVSVSYQTEHHWDKKKTLITITSKTTFPASSQCHTQLSNLTFDFNQNTWYYLCSLHTEAPVQRVSHRGMHTTIRLAEITWPYAKAHRGKKNSDFSENRTSPHHTGFYFWQ